MDKTISVLARTNRALLPVGAALMEQNIPHYYVGKSGFFAQPEIKSVLAYLGCVLYPADWLVAGAIRAPFFPSKFLPKSTLLAKLKEQHECEADPGKQTYFNCLARVPELLVDAKNLPALRDFTNFLHSLSRYKSLPPADALKSVISALRAVEYYSVEEDHSGDNDPVGNLVELTKLAAKHSTIKEFLDYTRRASAASKGRKGVALGTVHSAKGLQWQDVYVIGCQEGLMPHAKSDDLEGERNCFFVACSRAEQRLTITYSGTPSPFILVV